jgi:hypothetical protein
MRTIVCIETGALHTERFYREQCVTLENLEIFYAPYNEGKGLIALEKARERLLWEERQPLNERVIERTVKAGETGQNKGNLSTIERISR